MLTISQVNTETQIVAVQELIREYTAWVFTLAPENNKAPTFEGGVRRRISHVARCLQTTYSASTSSHAGWTASRVHISQGA